MDDMSYLEKEARERLQAKLVAGSASTEDWMSALLFSSTISQKRIADALEQINHSLNARL